MGKIDERFAELESFIEDLSVEADKSKTSMETAEKFMSAISNIKLESKENFEIYIKSLKESVSADLQYFRDKSKIIRIVSPNTANYIDSEILEFEKQYLKFISYVGEYSKQGEVLFEQHADELFNTISKIIDLGPKINFYIEYTHNFFQDTLRFLKGNF